MLIFPFLNMFMMWFPMVRRDVRTSTDHTRVAVSRGSVTCPCPTQETQITIKYGISTFMSKYFIFALYLPLFQLILDVFILNTQELVFGWKVYDYVSYQRYRFSVRDQRCVARRPTCYGAFTPSTRLRTRSRPDL